MSYGEFAHYYDLLMADAPYEQWVSYTNHAIKMYAPQTKSIIDLGCGTGEIAIRLSKNGYDLTGVDLSNEMLAIAHQKSVESNTTITWTEQDIRSLKSPHKYDMAVSFCDVVNYLVDEKDVGSFFSNVYNTLSDGGLFLFDVHSETYLHHFLMNQTFAEVQENVSYIWFCDQGENDSVHHDLTFFVKGVDNTYKRFDEFHIQRTYPIAFYQNILQNIGFTVLGIHSDFSFNELKENGDRIFFTCQK
jgi:SAM-dependent methyltransferase